MMKSGFTIFETLIVVSIFALIAMALGAFQKDLWIQNTFMQNSIIAESEARTALKNIVAELRAATAGNDGSYALQAASSTSITFFTDLDKDSTREKVRYYIQNGNLMKGVIEASGSPAVYVDSDERKKIVVHTVTNAGSGIFSFYDDNYDGASTTAPLAYPINLSLIRMARVIITIDADPNRSPVPLTFQSQVSIRNLKDNL